MSLFGNKKITAFGLDISDSSIKVAELSLHKGHISSAVFADVPLQDKTITNHMIVSEQRLAGNIQKALTTAKNIKSKFVVCSIPEAKSFVRVISLPKMAPEEIEGAIPFELEQDIPIPIDQVYMDWFVLQEFPDKTEVLVTASSKDYIDSLISTLKSLKLRPVAFEIGSQATARALIGKDEEKKSVLIVDIGAQQTSFIIVDKGLPLYTSSVPIAGNSFSDSIARNMGIPRAEADKLKTTHGLTSNTEGEEKVRTAVLPILDNIIDETKNVIRFFEDHSETKSIIDTILCCGASSQIPGLIDYVSTRINLGSGKTTLQVGMGNPFTKMIPAHNHQLPLAAEKALGYSTAIGLALRGNDYEAN